MIAEYIAIGVSAALTAIGLGLALSASRVDQYLRGGSTRRDSRRTGGQAAEFSSLPSAADYQAEKLEVRTWALSTERAAYIKRRQRSYLCAVGGGLISFAGTYLLIAFRTAMPGSGIDQAADGEQPLWSSGY
jgi:hypothetical protein